ncbi:hypothetical protein [uncultured Campylobacter sp.]|uniref:hypothetical protein n=1 Tax=uncultured Campylobacter sp. TaxID=218934 RepID=UPI0025E71D72|nr:hypothetical protein [uncultured Campylobacter sp.]
MKIISKFKDNYDFMVSKYGLDEMLVYDHRNSTPVGADELWKLSKIDQMDFEKKLGGYRFAGDKFINLIEREAEPNQATNLQKGGKFSRELATRVKF